jgi:hypothetical protein
MYAGNDGAQAGDGSKSISGGVLQDGIGLAGKAPAEQVAGRIDNTGGTAFQV